jgi:hypothetical protein
MQHHLLKLVMQSSFPVVVLTSPRRCPQIPFIDADALLESVGKILEKDKTAPTPLLTKGERLRNQPGRKHLFLAPRDGDDGEALNGGEAAQAANGAKKKVAKTPKVQKGGGAARVDASL